ncbi:MAG: response regulator transcription factor, partial [Aquirufa sp.]
MTKYKLLIADDHTLFNEGIKQLLSDYYHIVGQVFDGKSVLPTIRTAQPDLILLDINLPSVN